MQLLQQTLNLISIGDRNAAGEAQARLDSLTKPPGSLGILEEVARKLAAIQGTPRLKTGNKVVMLMAGDHGVTAEGVSAFPQEVTSQMVLNILNQGAAINVLSNHAGAKVVVTDVGVIGPAASHPKLNVRKIREGTGNIAKEAAMAEAEAIAAIEVGIDLVSKEIDQGATMIATGEMGIGNTTPSSAILAVFTGADIDLITGRGTGIDTASLQNKRKVIQEALRTNQPDPDKPLEVLAKVGGLEIAALTGVILGAAARRVPVVVDGFISSAAALVAYKLKAECADFMFASHLSQEPGHKIALDYMGLRPVLHLELRLGEGTGAVLAFNLLEAAIKIINEMATFAEAGVSNKG